jgi:hypothetical protein
MMRKLYFFIVLLMVVILACATTPATPAPEVNDIVVQTLAAYTVEAALTQGAGLLATTPAVDITITAPPPAVVTIITPGTLTPAIDITVTPSPSVTVTVVTPISVTPEEVAPSPLPVTNTGIILNNGECFNLDNGQVLAAPEAQCDLWLVAPAMFRQVNGAQLSGNNVSYTPPTRSKCVNGKYEAGDLAIQTDLHMCFITNLGALGFVVVRQYRGAVPFTGIVFDYWIFR